MPIRRDEGRRLHRAYACGEEDRLRFRPCEYGVHTYVGHHHAIAARQRLRADRGIAGVDLSKVFEESRSEAAVRRDL